MLQLALRTLDCGPGLKNMVGDEKRGQGRKIWLGTKNMVGDEKYGWGRKIWSGTKIMVRTKKLEEKTDKKKKKQKFGVKKLLH